jgi:hypothetical protein
MSSQTLGEKMKKFAGRKTVDRIRQQCAEQGIKLDMGLYEKGSDYIVVHLPGQNGCPVPVLYSDVNGRFFCAATGVAHFSSDDALDGSVWFDAMLEFFYTPGIGESLSSRLAA